VDWLNNRHLREHIAKIPTAEANCYTALDIEPMAA